MSEELKPFWIEPAKNAFNILRCLLEKEQDEEELYSIEDLVSGIITETDIDVENCAISLLDAIRNVETESIFADDWREVPEDGDRYTPCNCCVKCPHCLGVIGKTSQWSTDPPTEPGWYWVYFFGRRCIARVRFCDRQQKYVYLEFGSMLEFVAEDHLDAKWLKIDEPES